MAHIRTQRLREDGRMSSSSSIDSLATNSSESEAGLLGNLTSSISDHHNHHEHTPENISTENFSNSQILENAKLGVKSSRVNGKGHDEHRRASIPVHLEKVKNGGRGSYLLKMDDDLRELLSQSRSAAGADGKKRRAKFTDVWLHYFNSMVVTGLVDASILTEQIASLHKTIYHIRPPKPRGFGISLSRLLHPILVKNTLTL